MPPPPPRPVPDTMPHKPDSLWIPGDASVAVRRMAGLSGDFKTLPLLSLRLQNELQGSGTLETREPESGVGPDAWGWLRGGVVAVGVWQKQ